MSTVREGWDRYAVAWARRYGGYDLRRAPVPVRRWQRAAYRTARVLSVLRVPPTAVAVLGFGCAVAVPVLATRTGTWPLLAGAGLVVLAVRAVKAVRELRSAQQQAVAQIKDRAGLLKARSAGLRVAFAERRRR